MALRSLIAEIEAAEPSDTIWQAAIDLSDSIESQFADVFEITLQAISQARHSDTFAALSTCLLEHLLEHDFSAFDTIEAKIRGGDEKVLYALAGCWKFGAAEAPVNAARWNALLTEYETQLLSYGGRLRLQEEGTDRTP